MERIDFIRFYHLLEVLPTYWPDWEKHFSNMDVDIPGRTEKADFYIFCIKQCKDVTEAKHVEQDMVAGHDVEACKQAVIKIFNEMEKPVLKYCEENGIPVFSREQDPTGDFFTGYTGKDDVDGENEAFIEKKGNDNYTQEQAERGHEALKKKYHEYKLAKEMEKSGAEEEKSSNNIPANADDNNANKIIPANSEVTQAEINEWYEKFIQLLKSKGVETNNQLALGAVRVIPKEKDLEVDSYFHQDIGPEEVESEMEKVAGLYVPAFLERDENEEVKKPFVKNQEYTNYLMKNIKTRPSDEHKRFLWQMAREGRLTLQCEDSTLGPASDSLFWTKPDGSVIVLDHANFFLPYEEFEKEIANEEAKKIRANKNLINKLINEEDAKKIITAADEKLGGIYKRREAWLNELGMTDEKAEDLLNKFQPLFQIYNKADQTFLEWQNKRLESIEDLEADSTKHPENTDQNNAVIADYASDHRDLIYNAHLWLKGARFITGMARYNPELFRNSDERNLLNKYTLQYMNIATDERFRNKKFDEGREEIGKRLPRIYQDGVYRKLKRMTGCKNYQEMMERGAIRDASGNPIPKGNKFKYYLQLAISVESRNDLMIEVRENGESKLVPFQWHGGRLDFVKTVNACGYADQLSDIERQIKKAKLPASEIGLEKSVKDAAWVIRDESLNANKQILENKLSELVDSMWDMRVKIANKVGNRSLTEKDLQQVKLMNRTANLLYASRLGELNPAENYRMKIAEKICSERAIELIKSQDPNVKKTGLKLLMSPSVHYSFLKRVMDSKALTDMIGNKNAKEQDKLLRKDNKAALKEFTKFYGKPLMPLKVESFKSLPSALKEIPKTVGQARLQAGQLLNEITVANKDGEVYKKMLYSAKELYELTLQWSEEEPDKKLNANEFRRFSDKFHAVLQNMTDYATSEKASDLSILREGTIILYEKIKVELANRGVSTDQLDFSMVEDLHRGEDGLGFGAQMAKIEEKRKKEGIISVPETKETPETKEKAEKLTDLIVKEIITPHMKGRPVSDKLKAQLHKTIAFKETLNYMDKRPELGIAFKEANNNDTKELAQITRAQSILMNTFRSIWSKEIFPYDKKENTEPKQMNENAPKEPHKEEPAIKGLK